MEQNPHAKSSIVQFGRRLLTYLSQDWLTALLDIYHLVRPFFVQQQNIGVYEILEYNSTLDLVDPKGKVAFFRRRQKVKFLQNNIMVFQDHAWGDGEIFADYKCSPGVVVDRYKEGDRWNILISLRETKSRGDITDFFIERTVKNGFLQANEWWQVEVWYKTQRLTLSLIFPKGRHCQRALLQTRSDNRSTILDQPQFHLLPDGRQLLRWEAINPAQAEVYTLRWQW